MFNINKKVKIGLILLITIFTISLLLYRSVIFQEGDPWTLIKAALKLNTNSEDVIKLDPDTDKYLTKSQNGIDSIKKIFTDNYSLVEQMGAAYIFENETERLIITQKQYSRFYSIWTITKEQKKKEVDNFNQDKYKQPETLKANYISFQDYSFSIFEVDKYKGTEFSVENREINCNITNQASSLPLRISKSEINGQKYCIGAFSEGAAGSVYTEYAYATVIKDNVYLILFTARYPNCSNYPNQQKMECETERVDFNLDDIIDQEIRNKEQTLLPFDI